MKIVIKVHRGSVVGVYTSDPALMDVTVDDIDEYPSRSAAAREEWLHDVPQGMFEQEFG